MRTLTASGSGSGSGACVLGSATDSGNACDAAGGGGGSAARAATLVSKSARSTRAVTPGRLSESQLVIPGLLGANDGDARGGVDEQRHGPGQERERIGLDADFRPALGAGARKVVASYPAHRAKE